MNWCGNQSYSFLMTRRRPFRNIKRQMPKASSAGVLSQGDRFVADLRDRPAFVLRTAAGKRSRRSHLSTCPPCCLADLCARLFGASPFRRTQMGLLAEVCFSRRRRACCLNVMRHLRRVVVCFLLLLWPSRLGQDTREGFAGCSESQQ
jgi:hypothetical protein